MAEPTYGRALELALDACTRAVPVSAELDAALTALATRAPNPLNRALALDSNGFTLEAPKGLATGCALEAHDGPITPDGVSLLTIACRCAVTFYCPSAGTLSGARCQIRVYTLPTVTDASFSVCNQVPC